MDSAQDTGKKIDEAAEKVKDKTRDALHKVGDKIEHAAD
jgi:hypothetical protein